MHGDWNRVIPLSPKVCRMLDSLTDMPPHDAPSADIHSIFKDVRPSADFARIALVGTFAPRKCGIATFTTDLFGTLAAYHPEFSIDVFALDDPADRTEYADNVFALTSDDPEAFACAAAMINQTAPDAVWLQHEYGIYGGECGEMVCDFVDRLAPPLILTLHTVLENPSDKQRAILDHLVTRASRIVVMSRQSRDLLHDRHDAPLERIAVIEHGAPDRPFGREEEFKAKLGLEGRTVLMTFGLLGPGKGLERVIEAMPSMISRHPQLIYRIVGATHPNLVAQEGEAYRERLMALAEKLGVQNHIQWDNRFLEIEELLDQLEACDIYITPYFNLQQSTSGTLSYAVALGKAVIATPYVHARELLDDGVGHLIRPDCAKDIAEAVCGLLDRPDALNAMKRAAYARGRKTIWPRFADASARLVREAMAPRAGIAQFAIAPNAHAIWAMSDATGMLQHSIGIVPDRRHGYCLDDNARALMFVNQSENLTEADRVTKSQIYASFIQHAWNPEARHFRNFMGFDRTWLEEAGSEDSNGRALWALGHTVENAPDPDLAAWARSWFDKALPALGALQSPRAIAFSMLGAAAVLRSAPDHKGARDLCMTGGQFLAGVLGGGRRPDWAWFEAVLGYDNPRLCQALLEAGAALGETEWLAAGIETLEWIATKQTAANGTFRPIGSESFGREQAYLPFDQQPLEAQAAIDAARTAYEVTGDPKWPQHANAAWEWFFGSNDRGVRLADLRTGRCRDGITPRGANENCGAESILAFHLSYCSMLALGRIQPGTDMVGGIVEGPEKQSV